MKFRCAPAGTRSVDAGGSPSWFDPEKLDAETQEILTSQLFIDHSYCTMIGCKKQNTNFSLTIHIDLAMKNWLYDEYNDIKHRDYRSKCWWPYLGTSLEWCTVWAIPKMAKLLSPDITRYMYPMYPMYVYPMYILRICMGWTASKIRKQLLSYCSKKGFSSGIANIRCESHGGMPCLEANCEYTSQHVPTMGTYTNGWRSKTIFWFTGLIFFWYDLPFLWNGASFKMILFSLN